jgi:hypothetical protein
METPKEYYYTYAYLRKDRTPYYIGKGCRDRIYSSNRTINKPKDKSRIIFLKQNLTEEEAFKHEIYMISMFGRKDLGTGILYNKTDGGEGSSGIVRSEECKKKISKSNKGKKRTEEFKSKMRAIHTGRKRRPFTEETKEKLSQSQMGEKNSFYGRKHTEEVKRKNKESKEVKSFSVISPTGEIIHSQNSNQFCRDNDLNNGHFSKLLNGKRKSHKGFRLYIP